MSKNKIRKLLSGNEAIALAALHSGCSLGVGYPGTPSTEILENLTEIGTEAQWAPNEKVAAEVALGAAFASGNALLTMKHVGFNVAQDLFFTASYSGTEGALVAIVADDPGMASSQNEQDTRSLAYAGGLPVLEPSDSQEAYDFVRLAFKLSRKWSLPFIVRTTTRVAHSNTIVEYDDVCDPKPAGAYTKDASLRVMVPGHARAAHKRLRAKLAEIAQYSAGEDSPNKILEGANNELGIISCGIAFQHAFEAAPEAGHFKLSITNPLPLAKVVEFTKKYKRCITIEEGDPYLNLHLRAAGANIDLREEKWRFGEFSVDKAKAQINKDMSADPAPQKAKAPELCKGCPHLFSFKPLLDLECIVAGDIGCYTLAAIAPLRAMDTTICMGSSIGVGVGMRNVLPEEKARKVVSVIGDSTFMHSGLTGLLEAVYNPPATGHVVIVVDNSTTAMTGQQDHPGTGRRLNGAASKIVSIEEVAKAMGVDNVAVFNPVRQQADFANYLKEKLAEDKITLIVLKQPCLLSMAKNIKIKNKS